MAAGLKAKKCQVALTAMAPPDIYPPLIFNQFWRKSENTARTLQSLRPRHGASRESHVKWANRLKQHFDNRQLVELTSCIAWENYRARFDHTFGCEAEGFSEGAYCPAPSAKKVAHDQ